MGCGAPRNFCVTKKICGPLYSGVCGKIKNLMLFGRESPEMLILIIA